MLFCKLFVSLHTHNTNIAWIIHLIYEENQKEYGYTICLPRASVAAIGQCQESNLALALSVHCEEWPPCQLMKRASYEDITYTYMYIWPVGHPWLAKCCKSTVKMEIHMTSMLLLLVIMDMLWDSYLIKFSRVSWYFLHCDGRILCEVTGRRKRSTVLLKGLVDPCIYLHLHGKASND